MPTKISGKIIYTSIWFPEAEQHDDLVVFQQKSDLISALQFNLIIYWN